MVETRIVKVPANSECQAAELAVHTHGEGPIAVLIHGFPLDHRMWLDVMHGELAERRTLCAIDLRGHGQSAFCGDAVHSMESLADDVAAVIASLGTDPVDVCGLSMGGYVAFALHARHRQRIRSLVLTNTRAAADTAEQRLGRDASIKAVQTHGPSAVADAMLPKLLGPNGTDHHRAQLQQMIEDVPAESIVADQRGLQRRADRRGELGQIEGEVMVIAGSEDVITPPSEAELMARGIPDARLEVIEGTGHMSPMEDPEAWSAAVMQLWR